MKNWLSAIGLVLAIIVVVMVGFFFATWFPMMLAFMLALGVLSWALGVPISVKEDGVKVGYIRWTKYYPTTPKKPVDTNNDP